MKKTLQTFHFLFDSFARMTVIGFLVSLGIVALTNLVFHLTDRVNPVHLVVALAGPFEAMDGIFVFIISLIVFIPNFRVALANGVSRKTYWLANLPVAVLFAAALSIINLIIAVVHRLFWPITFISEMIYPHINWVGVLVFQFALYFLLISAGWAITLAYYRSSMLVKWVVSGAPVTVYYLLSAANARLGGAIALSIGEYLRTTLSDPYTAALSWLAYAAVLCGVVYLLLRRAPLKV